MGKGGQGKGDKRLIEDPSAVVWLGNVPEAAKNTDLMNLGEQVGTPIWAEVMRRGNGALAFATAEEAKNAMEKLNGAQLGESVVEAGPWERKTPGKSWSGRSGVWKPYFQKDWGSSWGGNWGKGSGKSGRRSIGDTEKAVWIGNVPEAATYEDLMNLGKQVGEPKFARVLKNNTAVIAFNSAEEVSQAVSMLNGAQLGDNVIEADVWEKKSK